MISDPELQAQCQEFLSLLGTSIAAGNLEDIHSEGWRPVRDFLQGVSRSRTRQGFSPSETAQFGQPEINLGLLPGAGGVVRTVRMLGIVQALMALLMQGQRVRPDKATELGIVDELVALDRVATVDFKGRYGLPIEDEPVTSQFEHVDEPIVDRRRDVVGCSSITQLGAGRRVEAFGQ